MVELTRVPGPETGPLSHIDPLTRNLGFFLGFFQFCNVLREVRSPSNKFYKKFHIDAAMGFVLNAVLVNRVQTNKYYRRNLMVCTYLISHFRPLERMMAALMDSDSEDAKSPGLQNSESSDGKSEVE